MTDKFEQLRSQGLILLTYVKEKATKTLEQVEIVKRQLTTISGFTESLWNSEGNVKAIGN